VNNTTAGVTNGGVNSQTNPATQNQDSITIYMTGLGTPNSLEADASGGSALYPGGCVSVSSYLALVNTASTAVTPHYTAPSPTWTGLEGAVMVEPGAKVGNSVLTTFPPCMSNLVSSSTVTVNFGTVTAPSANLAYAGFVPDSVAGLYQVNVTVPAGVNTTSAPIQVPVTVTIGGTISGFTSPPVMMWVHQ
jgi:hypothetical protein